MEFITHLIESPNGIVWGPAMLILILGTGLYLMAELKFIPLRYLIDGFKHLWQGRAPSGEGDFADVATAIFQRIFCQSQFTVTKH